eukprot:gene15577-biopygen6692
MNFTFTSDVRILRPGSGRWDPTDAFRQTGSCVLRSAAFAFTCVLRSGTCVLRSGCCVRVRLRSRSAAFCVRLRSANIARSHRSDRADRRGRGAGWDQPRAVAAHRAGARHAVDNGSAAGGRHRAPHPLCRRPPGSGKGPELGRRGVFWNPMYKACGPEEAGAMALEGAEAVIQIIEAGCKGTAQDRGQIHNDRDGADAGARLLVDARLRDQPPRFRRRRAVGRAVPRAVRPRRRGAGCPSDGEKAEALPPELRAAYEDLLHNLAMCPHPIVERGAGTLRPTRGVSQGIAVCSLCPEGSWHFAVGSVEVLIPVLGLIYVMFAPPQSAHLPISSLLFIRFSIPKYKAYLPRSCLPEYCHPAAGESANDEDHVDDGIALGSSEQSWATISSSFSAHSHTSTPPDAGDDAEAPQAPIKVVVTQLNS